MKKVKTHAKKNRSRRKNNKKVAPQRRFTKDEYPQQNFEKEKFEGKPMLTESHEINPEDALEVGTKKKDDYSFEQAQEKINLTHHETKLENVRTFVFLTFIPVFLTDVLIIYKDYPKKEFIPN